MTSFSDFLKWAEQWLIDPYVFSFDSSYTAFNICIYIAICNIFNTYTLELSWVYIFL